MPLPRGLILLASAWLFFSWIASMGIHPPLLAATSSYTPAVRLMLFSSAVGALIAWPLLRLCQAPSPAPWRDTLLDMVVVLGMLNMVLWPLRLVTPWPPLRMGAIQLMIGLGVLTVGAVLVVATGSTRRWLRSAAMVVVLLLSLGSIAWRLVAPEQSAPFPSVFGGPLEALLALATSGGAPPTANDRAAIQGAIGVTMVAWSVALVITALRRRAERGGRLPASVGPDTLAVWS